MPIKENNHLNNALKYALKYLQSHKKFDMVKLYMLILDLELKKPV